MPIVNKKNAFMAAQAAVALAGVDTVITFNPALPEAPTLYDIVYLDANGALTYVSAVPTAAQLVVHNAGASDAGIWVWASCPPHDVR